MTYERFKEILLEEGMKEEQIERLWKYKPEHLAEEDLNEERLRKITRLTLGKDGFLDSNNPYLIAAAADVIQKRHEAN